MLGDPGPWRPPGRWRRWLTRARIRVGAWLGLELEV